MKNSLCLGALCVALLGLGVARGQQPTYPTTSNGDNGAAPSGEPGTPPGGMPLPPGVSSWLQYARPCGCCGPVGKNGEIGYETYLRTGACFALGDGVLGRVMKPGLMIQGGGRTLFFNAHADAAWTADLGVTTLWLDGGESRETVVLRNVAGAPAGGLVVTPSSINQTYLQLGFGREQWLYGLADPCDPGPKWRVGWDVGGRWGSAKLVLREVQHFTDIVGGVYAALHTDVEVPCGCCVFQAGVRAEFGYIWSDILEPRNRADLQSLGVLVQLGLRF